MLFDTIANMFVGSLFIVINDAVAMRSVADLLKTPQFPFSRFADSLQLYKIGDLNTQTGELDADKKFICECKDLVNSDKEKHNEVSDKV